LIRRNALRRFLPLGVVAVLLACGTLSVEEEKELGTQAQRQVRDEFDMVRDRVIVNYVRDLGAELVNASDPSPFRFRFYAVEDDSINAFALPGGAIYVHTGTITKARNVSELAGVIAHEIGHVTARHVAELYPKQRATSVGLNLFALLAAILSGNPYIANAAGLGGQVAAQAYLSTFTQEAELESDILAVEALIRAGYDPHGMVTFFDTLKQETAQGLAMPQFLSSHPATDERIASVKATIRAREPLPPLRRDDGGKLEIIQRRIDLVIGTDPLAR
jgi:predicted Zn-dependent protease